MTLWIATNLDGSQRAFEFKPHKHEAWYGYWGNGGAKIKIPNDNKLLPAQTWEDEPELVEFKAVS